MIKLKEVIEKYQDYGVDEEKLKEILIKPNPKSIWDLSKGNSYYRIGPVSYGAIIYDTWEDTDIDRSARATGNIFLTKEEAEFEVKRKTIETTLLKYGRRNFKYAEPNYYFGYNHISDYFYYDSSSLSQFEGVIYFDTKELRRKAIDEVGEENIKKYIFGVTDDE